MNQINGTVLLAIVAAATVIAFAIMAKSSQTSAHAAGEAEAETKAEKEAAKIEEELDERIQTADVIIAAQRDPASGVERLQSGTL
jgi:hypothetical protein